MTFTKKTWTKTDILTLVELQRLDSQYEEFCTDLQNHIEEGHPTVYWPKEDMDSIFWHSGNDGEGSGLDADTLDGVHGADLMVGVASGIMVWWNPENGSVPTGFLFCDGSSGTMDMRNRFPIGASSTININEAVGNSQITPVCSCTVGACTLTVSNIHHTHSLSDYQDRGNADAAYGTGGYTLNTEVDNTNATVDNVGVGGSHTHPGTFTGDANTLDPVFRYLVIIQKS